ncbi:MAG: hypothetical protein CL674_17115 [Bdellovibrionaceae bacterium]|nr:hypothetical protein [Pseudobdellovibrionaceae bacterium]|tara:strand:+ start:12042 stop:13454 length:1413 start_codon:yes stop_codon:yes gene_type:complete
MAIKPKTYRASDYHRFQQNLALEIEDLSLAISSNNVSKQKIKYGAELESWIVDKNNFDAQAKNDWLLKELSNKSFVPELSKFNVEYNSNVYDASGFCLKKFESELQIAEHKLRRAAESIDCKVLHIGSLPNLSRNKMQIKNMSSKERYHTLNQQILDKNNGNPQHYKIEGADEKLDFLSESIMPVAATTSFQMHYQPVFEDFIPSYNACLYLSAPMLALTANTPFLFGKRLWDESRIPLFEQSMPASAAHFGRVGLGCGFLKDSVCEYFRYNHDEYDVFFPENENFERGRFTHNSVHNGTIWHWNRVVVGSGDEGQDYGVRIEFRPVSAGPSSVDMTAHFAMFLGLAKNLSSENIGEEFRMEDLVENFYSAAKNSFDGKILGLNQKQYSYQDYLIGELIPRAEQGLKDLGVEKEQIQYYLKNNILPRCKSKLNGANWQKAFVEKNGRDFSKMLSQYWENQNKNLSLIEWK